jgi:D-erythro-7,8-dihydroneopterin triphosphate epimerase
VIIHIKNLRLRTIVGVNEWEQHRPQLVVVSIRLEFDAPEVARTDSLDETIDYTDVQRRVAETVEGSRYQLVERLAAEVLEQVMADSRVIRATVEVDKPRALRFADSVSVTVSGERGGG